MAKRLDIPEETILYVKDLLAGKNESGYSLTKIARMAGVSYGIVCGIYYKRFRVNETGVKRDKLKPEEAETIKRLLRERDFGKSNLTIKEVADLTGISRSTVYNINYGISYSNIN